MNTPSSLPGSIAVIGGTGSLGGGLARRWARAGHRIHIGSRDGARAAAAAAELAASLPGTRISGHANPEAAAAAELVVLAVPFAHQRPILEDIRGALRGKILVDTTVPLVPPKVMRVQLPAEGCAALITQGIVGAETTVVSAFQNVAADVLAADADPDCDVLVAGDKAEAREVVIGLARQAGFRAWHAGALANSAAMEALTSVLIFMNKHYAPGHAGIRITGVAPRSH
ncbi:MAG: NADPH-dependent F420 reductase [Gammaproteobacteria bacterium]|nr:NADPH-dependent F420 reductase [Gammaproteobacteria bacterium]